MPAVTKPIEATIIDATTTLYKWDSGSMLSSSVGGGVLLHVCQGIFPENAADIVAADCERELALHKRCVCMVDSIDQKQMSTGFREKMTAYLARHDDVVSHLLISSMLMRMAINVANLVIKSGAVKAYSNVTEWEAVGRKYIATFPGRRRRPAAEARPTV